MINVYKHKMPIVSIVMPTFNRKDYLERSINSILAQTFKDWELIISDDGSSDGTFDIADKYLCKYENIRYIKHSNRKSPLATNAGILASSGRYITFIGSDDQYKPDHIQLRIGYMQNNPEVDMIHSGAEIIGHPFVKDKNDLTKEIHISECVIGGTFFGKREIFFELGGFKDLSYSDDSDFFERAVQKFKVRKVDWNTYIYYRDTPDSICTTIK
ncbi:MAG TPA: glycosyltransferase family A protein [Melioribacteraceae bacterium]|nr:glycosyltransferase family A protein [Melioribacteraceae bacterium]